jgi:hypothetical protein
MTRFLASDVQLWRLTQIICCRACEPGRTGGNPGMAGGGGLDGVRAGAGAVVWLSGRYRTTRAMANAVRKALTRDQAK